MISTFEKDFSSNKSSSPLTRNPQRYAPATPRIGLSFGSRKGDGISPTSSLSKETETSFETSWFATRVLCQSGSDHPKFQESRLSSPARRYDVCLDRLSRMRRSQRDQSYSSPPRV